MNGHSVTFSEEIDRVYFSTKEVALILGMNEMQFAYFLERHPIEASRNRRKWKRFTAKDINKMIAIRSQTK